MRFKMREKELDLSLTEAIDYVIGQWKEIYGINYIPKDKDIVFAIRHETKKFTENEILIELENQKIVKNFENYLTKFELKIDDVEPCEAKGYWKVKKPCGGLKGGCKHPMHRFMFCEKSVNHIISYFDNQRGKDGKFQSCYKTWNLHRKMLGLIE